MLHYRAIFIGGTMLSRESIDEAILREREEPQKIEEEIREDITEEEAIEIYNELLQVLIKHNVSYKTGLDIFISATYAFMTGAAELYDE